MAQTLITANILLTPCESYEYGVGEAIKHAAFSVSSIISTTGFATEDFNLWPTFSKVILVTLMFVGACAGSTGGGMKVSRFLILGKSASNEMRKTLHPKQVKRLTIDGRVIEPEVDVEVDVLDKVSWRGGKYRQMLQEPNKKERDNGNIGVAIAVAMLVFVIGVGVYENSDSIQTNLLQNQKKSKE